MTKHANAATEQRIQTLETKYKRLTFTFWAAVSLLGSAALVGSGSRNAEPKVIAAEEFRLVSQDGTKIASFNKTEDQCPGIWIYPDGKESVAMIQTSSGGALFFGSLQCNAQGKQALVIDSATNGSAGIWYTDSKGRDSQVLWSDGNRFEVRQSGSAGGGRIRGDGG